VSIFFTDRSASTKAYQKNKKKMGVVIQKNEMTSCQYKQSTEQHALFKNKVDPFKDPSLKPTLTVSSNPFRTLRTHCIRGM
jgi:hypothetical protein